MQVKLARGKITEIHKSMLNLYSLCPRRFYFTYIVGINPPIPREARIGTMFHEFAKEFFEKSSDHPESLDELMALIPENHPEELKEMERWFVQIEWKRWNMNPYRWKPVLMEHTIIKTWQGIPIGGTIDRVDQIGENTYELVEYKTTGGVHLTQWRRELMFYRLLLEPEYPIKSMVVVNPRRKEILEIRVTNRTLAALKKLLKKLLNDNKFEVKVGDHCFYCPFMRRCPYWVKNNDVHRRF